MGKDCKISLTSILHKKSGQQNVSFLLIMKMILKTDKWFFLSSSLKTFLKNSLQFIASKVNCLKVNSLICIAINYTAKNKNHIPYYHLSRSSKLTH